MIFSITLAFPSNSHGACSSTYALINLHTSDSNDAAPIFETLSWMDRSVWMKLSSSPSRNGWGLMVSCKYGKNWDQFSATVSLISSFFRGNMLLGMITTCFPFLIVNSGIFIGCWRLPLPSESSDALEFDSPPILR